jgi:hypothetical protein
MRGANLARAGLNRSFAFASREKHGAMLITHTAQVWEGRTRLRRRRRDSKHPSKLFDGNFQVLDDGAQCFALQFATMHWDHDSGSLART